MLESFQNVPLIQPTPVLDIALALGVAFLCGMIISAVYRWSYRGVSYSPSFVRAMIFLAMITAVVMLVIGNNLARAFGLVGAMSIIRFRTAVKDPQDIVFIFFALAVGLAAGVGMYRVALTATVIIGVAILLVTGTNYGAIHRQSYLLQLTYAGTYDAEAGEPPPYVAVLQRLCRKHQLINARALDASQEMELTFYLDLKRGITQEAVTRALKDTPQVSHVNVYFDTEQA